MSWHPDVVAARNGEQPSDKPMLIDHQVPKYQKPARSPEQHTKVLVTHLSPEDKKLIESSSHPTAVSMGYNLANEPMGDPLVDQQLRSAQISGLGRQRLSAEDRVILLEAEIKNLNLVITVMSGQITQILTILETKRNIL